MSLVVTFKSKAPFRDIDGVKYCLRQYQVTDQLTSDKIVAKFEWLASQFGLRNALRLIGIEQSVKMTSSNELTG
jgi:hypothetical protein